MLHDLKRIQKYLSIVTYQKDVSFTHKLVGTSPNGDQEYNLGWREDPHWCTSPSVGSFLLYEFIPFPPRNSQTSFPQQELTVSQRKNRPATDLWVPELACRHQPGGLSGNTALPLCLCIYVCICMCAHWGRHTVGEGSGSGFWLFGFYFQLHDFGSPPSPQLNLDFLICRMREKTLTHMGVVGIKPNNHRNYFSKCLDPVSTLNSQQYHNLVLFSLHF